MKRIISMVCILLLLVATSNLAVNIHFCANKVSSIDFFGKSKTCGGCDSKTRIKEKSCCKNFSATITTSDVTSSNFSFQTEQLTTALVPVIYVHTNKSVYTSQLLKGTVCSNAPPNVSAQPHYILYRSLII
jgi:hypothetical protein